MDDGDILGSRSTNNGPFLSPDDSGGGRPPVRSTSNTMDNKDNLDDYPDIDNSGGFRELSAPLTLDLNPLCKKQGIIFLLSRIGFHNAVRSKSSQQGRNLMTCVAMCACKCPETYEREERKKQ